MKTVDGKLVYESDEEMIADSYNIMWDGIEGEGEAVVRLREAAQKPKDYDFPESEQIHHVAEFKTGRRSFRVGTGGCATTREAVLDFILPPLQAYIDHYSRMPNVLDVTVRFCWVRSELPQGFKSAANGASGE